MKRTRRKPLIVNRADFRRVVVDHADPDTSYLEQDGFEERLADFKRGDFSFIGVRAAVEVCIPSKRLGPRATIERMPTLIESPGCWGVESDASEEDLREIYEEECATLEHMLTALGVKVTNEPAPVRLLLDETYTCTLAELLRQNENLDPEDVRRLKSLAPGEAFTLGGGAIATMHVRRMS